MMSGALSSEQIERFVADGFVRLDEAFPREVAEVCRNVLWAASGCDPENRGTWTRPVVRIGGIASPPFRAAADTPRLHAAFDQLVGVGRWRPLGGLGTFPIRFPSAEAPGDAGWHVDAGFDEHLADFFDWRINVVSRGRSLLLLFLLSDVEEEDAPTRIRVGSHRAIARRLAPAGEAGLTLRELLGDFAATAALPEAYATGPAGTVYLCHPFVVHAAQAIRSERVRFLAQPPLLAAEPLRLDRAEGETSPVERAIRRALDGG